jgi:hypothetical protein
MLNKFFKKRLEIPTEQPLSESPVLVEETIHPTPRLSIEEQKERQKQRKRLIIDEFGKSVINFLYDEIWTPLHIIDFIEVDFPKGSPLKITVENAIKESLETHKENLRGKIYKQSFNLQPGNLLMVVKDRYNESITSLRNRNRDIEKLIGFFNPSVHRLLLVRHFRPPIPDDLYKYDDVMLPPQFEEALKEIVNYCDLNYSTDNVNFSKWQKLIYDLSDSGVMLHFPNNPQEVHLKELLNSDYSNIGYNKITVKQILKDTVEKQTIVIPLFIIFLAFFCSDISEKNIFPYHYLFTATGSSKNYTSTYGLFSFPKLFNKLLDESLLPKQFNKCLSIIYNEAFRMRQTEIDDLLIDFREVGKQ